MQNKLYMNNRQSEKKNGIAQLSIILQNLDNRILISNSKFKFKIAFTYCLEKLLGITPTMSALLT